MNKETTLQRLNPVNTYIPTGLMLPTTTSGTACDIHGKYCGVINRVAVPPCNAGFLHDFAECQEIENMKMGLKRKMNAVMSRMKNCDSGVVI